MVLDWRFRPEETELTRGSNKGTCSKWYHVTRGQRVCQSASRVGEKSKIPKAVEWKDFISVLSIFSPLSALATGQRR